MSVLLAFVLAGTALMPARASAQCGTSPGNSAIDQYCEDVPSANPAGGGAPAGTPARPLAAADRRRLAARGSDGRGVLGLIEANAPATREAPREATRRPDRGARSRSTDPGRSPHARSIAEPDRGGVLGAVTAAARADTGLGGKLWWLLGATTVLMLLAAVLRRHRRSD